MHPLKNMNYSRLLSLVLIMSLVFSTIVVQKTSKAAWNNNYALTGNQANDMVSIALAQKGKSANELGYNIPWCAAFVSDCAKKAGATKAKKNTKTKDGNTLRKVRLNETTVVTELVLNNKHAKNYNMYRAYRQLKDDFKNNPLDENASDSQKRMYDAKLQVLSDLYKKNEAAMKDGRKYWNQANGVTKSKADVVVTKNDKIDYNVFERQIDQIAAHRITGDKTNATIRFNDFNTYLKKAAFSTTKVDFSTTAAEIDTYAVEYPNGHSATIARSTPSKNAMANSYDAFKKHTSDIKLQISTASSRNRTCMM